MSQVSKAVLRVAFAGVVLWFGVNQLVNPNLWAAWVPAWAESIAPASTLVILNGLSEVVLGVLLVAGLFTRLSALILSLKVLTIALSIGYNDIGVRDAGIAIALFCVFLQGPDKWCADSYFPSKNALVRLLQLRYRNP